MSFTVHTFEVNASEKELSFAFHEAIGESQDLYFLAKMNVGAQAPRDIAEEIFGAIYDYYQEHTELPSYERFEKALKNANKESEKWESAWGGVPDIVIACFDFNQLYLSQSGNAETYLVRGGTSTQISESMDASKELFVNVLNGTVSVRDVLILSSERLLRSISASHLSQIFDRREFNSAVSLLRQELGNCADESLLVTTLGINAKEANSSGALLGGIKKKVLDLKNKPQTKDRSARSQDLFSSQGLVNSAKGLFDSLVSSPKKGGIALAVIVSLILIWNLTQKQEVKVVEEDEQEIRQQMTFAAEAIDQATILSGTGKNKEARASLERSKEALDQAFNDTSNEAIRVEVAKQKKRIDSILNEMEKAYFKTPELVSDLGQITTDPIFDGILSYRGNYYVYDDKKVAKAVQGKVDSAIPITQEEVIIEGQIDTGGNIVFLTNGPRIIEYQPGGATTVMTTSDETWKGGIDIDTYNQNRAYVLSPQDNQIWRYVRSRSGYGDAQPYNDTADLSQAVSFTVGKYIFVISEDGSIVKIEEGRQVEYDFREKPTEEFEGKNLQIFTQSEHQNLYILDPDRKRILIFGKGELTAIYKKQIKYDIADPVHNFVINEDENKASLVTHTSIYEVTFE